MELNLQKSNKFAQMAQHAYLDLNGKIPYMGMGYIEHRFIEHDGAQCHIVWDKEEIVVCFRGTEPDELSDILADLNAIPRKSMTDGWVHSGFRGELDKLWNMITNIIDQHTKSYVSFNVPSSNCFSFEFIADDDIEKVNEKLVPVGLMFSKALIQQTFYKLETVTYQ